MNISKISLNSFSNSIVSNNAVQAHKSQISSPLKAYPADTVSFTARPLKAVEDVADSVFEKLFKIRKNNSLGTYLGTTRTGENIAIRETRFGNAADLYISYADKKTPDEFKIFHIEKVFNEPSKITTGDGDKVVYSEVKKVQQILDDLA